VSYTRIKIKRRYASLIVFPIHLQFLNKKTIKASFDIAWKIARSKKAHDFGKEFIKSAAIYMVRTVCGDDITNKLELIPLSNNTIK
jgi:hypothetical protein